MAKKTTNYNLHKIDLSDSPPDITMINPNWDEIDRLLKSLSDALGGIDLTTIQQKLSGHLEETMPHKYIGADGVKYRWGLGEDAGGLYFIREEVV